MSKEGQREGNLTSSKHDSKFIPKATPMRPNKESEKVPMVSCRFKRIITFRWLEQTAIAFQFNWTGFCRRCFKEYLATLMHNAQPVQIDKDDTLWVVNQAFQLPGLVAQLLSLHGPVWQHKCTIRTKLASNPRNGQRQMKCVFFLQKSLVFMNV